MHRIFLVFPLSGGVSPMEFCSCTRPCCLAVLKNNKVHVALLDGSYHLSAHNSFYFQEPVQRCFFLGYDRSQFSSGKREDLVVFTKVRKFEEILALLRIVDDKATVCKVDAHFPRILLIGDTDYVHNVLIKFDLVVLDRKSV